MKRFRFIDVWDLVLGDSCSAKEGIMLVLSSEYLVQSPHFCVPEIANSGKHLLQLRKLSGLSHLIYLPLQSALADEVFLASGFSPMHSQSLPENLFHRQLKTFQHRTA